MSTHAILSRRNQAQASDLATKLYIPSTKYTQMNILPFFFGADWAARAFTDNVCNFAKVSNFDDGFFILTFIGKTNKKLKFLWILGAH